MPRKTKARKRKSTSKKCYIVVSNQGKMQPHAYVGATKDLEEAKRWAAEKNLLNGEKGASVIDGDSNMYVWRIQ